MTWIAIAVAGSNLIGGMISSNAQSDAAGYAADAQTAASQAGIAEQQRQFDAIQKLLQPYVQAGPGALTGQQNLIGLNGAGPQQSAIDALQQSPQFTSALQLGERSILSNASATGGLRGGNVQAALAQFSPQLLSQMINDQYSRLGGITSMGQNSAVMQGNAGMQTGNNVTQLLGQVGQAQAGGALGQGRATAGWVNSATGALGQFAGMGGFNGWGQPNQTGGLGYAPNSAGSNTGSDLYGWKGAGGF